MARNVLAAEAVPRTHGEWLQRVVAITRILGPLQEALGLVLEGLGPVGGGVVLRILPARDIGLERVVSLARDETGAQNQYFQKLTFSGTSWPAMVVPPRPTTRGRPMGTGG